MALAIDKAPSPTTVSTYARMCIVWDWLTTLGVCRTCGLGIACMQVEREAGNPTWEPHLGGCSRRNKDCAELAREHLNELPGRTP
jgi:hypothetical protein